MREANHITSEPVISVGLMTGVEEVQFKLSGEYASTDGRRFPPGAYHAMARGNRLFIHDSQGQLLVTAPEIELMPNDVSPGSFTVVNVPIGRDFHWHQEQELSFQGSLILKCTPTARLMVINRLPLEAYLTSVIASEMSAFAPLEFLKAHAIISRSWLLAQLHRRGREPDSPPSEKCRALRMSIPDSQSTSLEIIRWSDRRAHTAFDVCADDHCQRYHGITRVSSLTVMDAIAETRGMVLTFDDEICDARFSKCCGGMTETYSTAWEDREIPYLAGTYDGERWPMDFPTPLAEEKAATYWITHRPPAFCNTSDRALIEQILPEIDQHTLAFFRWQIDYEQDRLRAIVEKKLGVDLGPILSLQPLRRGVSGRIITLAIRGEKRSVVIGKELEIRRVLSETHLYSSAFIVRAEGEGSIPHRFHLIGAGWGHGVGLCQIGAAVMARQGKSHVEILAHYFRGTALRRVYTAPAAPSDER